MKNPVPSNEEVEILSDDSSGDEGHKTPGKKLPDSVELSPEAWLFRKAKSYQEYMKLIAIPTKRGTVIPFTSWVGLGSSIKKIYQQPLHYLTNIHLKLLDQERLGAEDEDVPLDMLIHPYKAESSIWLIEEVHRLTSSPHILVKLWNEDPTYHVFIDPVFPKLTKDVKVLGRQSSLRR